MDGTIVLFGSALLLIIGLFITSLVMFIRDGKSARINHCSRSAKKAVFFTVMQTLIIEILMFVLMFITSFADYAFTVFFPIVFIGSVIFFFIDIIIHQKLRLIDKVIIAVPIAMAGSVALYVALALISILFLGGDLP